MESGVQTLGWQADVYVFGQAPVPVGCPGMWPDFSDLAEVEDGGPPKALVGLGPILVTEANWASDNAS